ncbi:unnamed protein product [Mycena citricolor]|uniref:Uncharacterized protein n=1 Tax=Mycena citricolor TaxID=2018698 RepID=A0AAD2K6B1_9AGAR|nr:unnamed protein product [Mycena citricolor]
MHDMAPQRWMQFKVLDDERDRICLQFLWSRIKERLVLRGQAGQFRWFVWSVVKFRVEHEHRR